MSFVRATDFPDPESEEVITLPLRKYYHTLHNDPEPSDEIIKDGEGVRRRLFMEIEKNFTNFGNLYYTATIYIGSNHQEFEIMYDTGSTVLWIPFEGCTGCGSGERKYFPSDTWTPSGQRHEIQYGKGYIEGDLGRDYVRFTKDGFPLVLTFMGADNGRDNEGFNVEGLIGLSPSAYSNNQDLITQQLFNARLIKAHTFGVGYLHYNAGQSKITFGGFDKEIVPSEDLFTWFPLINRWWWSINISGVYSSIFGNIIINLLLFQF